MTAGTQEHGELLAEVVDALVALDLDARSENGSLVVDGSRHQLLLVARAHPTPADLSDLVREGGAAAPVVAVTDRISDAGREVLRSHGWGWLDRRGHVRIWTPGLRIESAVPTAGAERSTSGNLWTTVGLEVALRALVDPDEPVTARRVAPNIGRSVGATDEMIRRFTHAGLIGRRTHRALLPDLFWETAANWPDDGWVPLTASIDDVAGRVDADQAVRVDERAATLGGARIAAAGEIPARCYVRSAAALRRLRSWIDRDAPPRSWVRAAPVDWSR